MLSDFSIILLFLVGAMLFASFGLLTAKLIRPSRPNDEKLSTYECGEDAIGNAWGQFNIKFYIIALIFVLFDVELAFLFPWATVFGQEALLQNADGTSGLWGWFSLAEAFIFIAVLGLGLAYAWRKGALDWVKAVKEHSTDKPAIPPSIYEEFNRKYK